MDYDKFDKIDNDTRFLRNVDYEKEFITRLMLRRPLNNNDLFEDTTDNYRLEVTSEALDQLEKEGMIIASRDEEGAIYYGLTKENRGKLSNENKNDQKTSLIDKQGEIPKPITRIITKKQRMIVLARQKFLCNNCGCGIRPAFYDDDDRKIAHIDHIHPFALRESYPKGEEFINETENLQALCIDCNLKKGTRLN